MSNVAKNPVYPEVKSDRVESEYKDLIEAGRRAWDESSSDAKAGFYSAVEAEVAGFVLWWDTLKAIEKKFNIDVWNVAREVRWDWAYSMGQRLAKKYKERDLKDLYDAYLAIFEGCCAQEYQEWNDRAIAWWNHGCPGVQPLKEMGKTDEEIKEMSGLFCLMDTALMKGFNPDFDVFPQPRLIMAGDEVCNYRIECNNYDGKK